MKKNWFCSTLFYNVALVSGIGAISYALFLIVPADCFKSRTDSSEVRRWLESEGDSSPALFGIVSHLDVTKGTIGVIAVVAAVLCVEYLFHVLHELTYDTPFEHLVPSLEKELMIVGFTAFLFKIVVTIEQDIDPDWYHALEYADILIPLFSFSYCVMGVALIFKTVRQCDAWSKGYHVTLLELLDDYFDATESWFGRHVTPHFSRVLTEVEFRIFHNIFCDTFKIQRHAFAFNEYVEKVTDMFVRNLVTIRLIDWLILCILVVLNLARNKLNITVFHCSKDDFVCYDRSSTILLTIMGGIVLLINIFVAVISRHIQLKIMEVKGVPHRNHLHSFLQHVEEQQDCEEKCARMDGTALKAAAAMAKTRVGLSKQTHHLPAHKKKRAENLASRLSAKMPNFIHSSSNPRPSTNADLSLISRAISDRIRSIFKRDSEKTVPPGSTKSSGNGSYSYSSNRGDESSAKELFEAKSIVSLSKPKAHLHVDHIRPLSETICPVGETKTNVAEELDTLLSISAPATSCKEEFLCPEDIETAGKYRSRSMDNPEVAPSSSKRKPNVSFIINAPRDNIMHVPMPIGLSNEINNYEEQNGPGITKTVDQVSMKALVSPIAEALQSVNEEIGSTPNRLEEPVSQTFVDFESHLLRSNSSLTIRGERVRRKSIIKSFIHQANPPIYDLNSRSRDAEIDATFLFGCPHLYFELVRGLMMFFALYWALFLSNFIAASRGAEWAVLCATPVFLASIVYVNIVADASLLMAVHSIDTDAVLEVLEQTEGSKMLGEQMREKLLSKLQGIGEPQAELFSLFHEIDECGNGNLSREEFAVFMNAIDIHFSRRKWKQIFREIDLNYDDKISFEELFLFLFPDHDVGRALERKKMKILTHRVKVKAKRRAESSKHKPRSGKVRSVLVAPSPDSCVEKEHSSSYDMEGRVGNISTSEQILRRRTAGTL
eukprot:gene2448-2683_t